jgi:gliding motility-associated-like protein
VLLAAAGGLSYSWSTGETNDSVYVSPLVNTIYSVVAGNSGCYDTAQFQVIVKPRPVATVTGPASVCSGQTISLTAGGGTSYAWNTGAGTSTISISPLTDTFYSLVASNTFACSDTAIHSVTVLPLPAVTISGISTICEGETTILSASGTGTITWSTGDANNIINVSPLVSTVYTASATNSCGTVSDPVTLSVNSLPLLNVSNDTTVLLGSSAGLLASGAATYVWSPVSGLSCSNCPDPVATLQSTTTYFVTGTNSNGCSVSGSVTITVDSEFDIFVPDIFSPNADGQNDVLFVRGAGIKEFTFIIYDRWGEKVFETNDQSIGWDGTYKGSVLNNAVFVYYLSASIINGEDIKVKGDITLIK